MSESRTEPTPDAVEAEAREGTPGTAPEAGQTRFEFAPSSSAEPPSESPPSAVEPTLESPSPASPTGPGVTLRVDDDKVGWIHFDLPGRKVNLLTTAVMETLRELLDEAIRKGVVGLGIVSDKPGTFIAGADVDEIAGIETAKEGTEKAAYGQAIFETLARFPRPTVAVVAGACVGGGYELALACRYRLAEDVPEVAIGLPEVKLGILPGFGGTQRLPRRSGLPVALDMILSGKTLPARPAAKRGLVDLLVPPGMGRAVAREILLGTRSVRASRPGRAATTAASFLPTRALMVAKARRTLAAKISRDQYPAPFLALDAIAAGYSLDEVAAYNNEARLLGETLVSDTSRALVELFRVHRETKEPKGISLALARPASRLAVVGAGIMGGGIAWLAAEHGKTIRVKDIAAEPLSGALKTAGGLWGKNVAKRRLSPRERDRRLERLSFTRDDSGFGRVDFVFEAVVENLEVKRQVVRELESVLPPGAVIATNTSSLRVDAIAAGAARPERILGLHFFNPVPRMPLVEVIAGRQTAPWAVATAYRLALDLGKTPVLVQDGPGFLVNRLLAFYLGEALDLQKEGGDIERVDEILVRFGMPVGPFELLDQIGIDVALKVTHVLTEAYGERLPAQVALGRLVESGRLGKKSGRGFYDYDGDKIRGQGDGTRRASGNASARVHPEEDVLDRLLLPMVNEASRLLDEGGIRPEDVDLAMVMGTGFPPFRGGLLRWADRRGVEGIITRLEGLTSQVARRFEPSDSLRRRAGGFYPKPE